MVVLVVLVMQIHPGAPTPALGRVASTAQMGSSREPTVRLVGPKPLRHQLIGTCPYGYFVNQRVPEVSQARITTVPDALGAGQSRSLRNRSIVT